MESTSLLGQCFVFHFLSEAEQAVFGGLSGVAGQQGIGPGAAMVYSRGGQVCTKEPRKASGSKNARGPGGEYSILD